MLNHLTLFLLNMKFSDKEKKRTNRNQRTISMHEENIKFPLWTNIPDPEFELTDDDHATDPTAEIKIIVR